MATLSAIFDHETGSTPLEITTHAELAELVDRVTRLTGGPVPSIAEITVAEDPYGLPMLYVGIGEDRGFVQELGNPPRATVGDPDATGDILFDYMANTQEVPAWQVVPRETVITVLTAYLDHDGLIPPDHPHLRPTS
ncbi:Imm1 family immunity protein [Actinosynnema sp. NPDC047251]|uniref:Uncharacterized protein n=1 Tax=Saccharothrix espanaensis (strain ATCC 51144 / DSM 44229 / JCM 9112 / NBRC 15066 / NRRL 15764) TaxID=1179773 RepID=K0JYL2_SACES|nr:Imm1 family immunity protein [Saccharothrix espanaensis]CCH29313.1 hypothetical protein BN6_19920 [Saccharothrix espanaensis DSM 44229]